MASQRKCPYKTCAADIGWNECGAQIFFLSIAYLILTTQSAQFTPLAVILYIAPPTIDLLCKNSCAKVLQIIKGGILLYVIFVFILCLLVINGSIIDSGEYYIMSKDTLVYEGFSISKRTIANSLLFVVAIPVVLKFSKPELNDQEYIKSVRKGDKVCR